MVLEYLIAEINSDCRNYNYEKSFPPVTLKVEDQLYKITVACGLQVLPGMFFCTRVADNLVIQYFLGMLVDSSDFIVQICYFIIDVIISNRFVVYFGCYRWQVESLYLV